MYYDSDPAYQVSVILHGKTRKTPWNLHQAYYSKEFLGFFYKDPWLPSTF
ncbi:hypothetical protein [Candidatus Cardinium hertigii]|uniref:Uncharacterized protein n=1 Tax=Candidatus Cardinium hertigii TaxID=247481 RepID=A0A2Z3LH05_9BACT|nr:hypothetical protein [Candidatus Cardinium hertigii]AWN81694.1 hypothetical protein DK880_00366 [Candidatus Cardinium hertigii]